MTDDLETRVIRKLMRRFLPFLGLCYIILYLDRLNIGVAALTMNSDLGISATAFGFAAGIYFWSYSLLEVPSNLILAKVGARRWIPRIMVTWGIVTIGMAAIQDEISLYVARFLLGVAEAGFSPGVLFFMTLWFPARVRGRVFGTLVAFIAVSGVTLPLCAHILQFTDGMAGLAGWRWLFILTGIPAILLAVICYRVLVDKPADASWLTDHERQWLVRTLAEERESHARQGHPLSPIRGLTDPRVLVLVVAFSCVTFGLNGYSFWLPQILKTFGAGTLQIGWLAAVPPLLAVVPMLLWSRHSDRVGERVWHFALPAGVGAAGFGLAAVSLDRPALAMVGFCIAAIGMYTALSVFFLVPSAFLNGVAAAAGLALINGLGNIGGYFGPQVTGILKDATGGFGGAVAGYGVALLIAGMIVVALGRALARGTAPTVGPVVSQPAPVSGAKP
ncbi:MFS transporter [Micromonospora sp. NBC_00898]|uniref:MFS transporter n=1 Tax=Micromonospora sp. NBC_00898 TaxID=2975981 RepID=UPI0038631189|nr:MFS transporter [Micromonospora sp. NBC_00898]